MYTSARTAASAAVVFTFMAGHAWGDAANGERLARQWCASCHVVSPDQMRASADVPAFSTIARTPGFDRDKLAFFLLDPHPKMPDMSMTRSEAADLAKYIASLATN